MDAIGIKEDGQAKEHHEAQLPDRSLLRLDVADYVQRFNQEVMQAYQSGVGSKMPADCGLARSLIPPGTAALRDFSYLAPEIPEFDAAKCVGCMACVTECPDTAILGKAIPESRLQCDDPEVRASWTKTRKFYDMPQK